jgi:hypothetical protein
MHSTKSAATTIVEGEADISLLEVLRLAEQLGVKCSVRNFWMHHDRGLVPKGRRIPGRGNVLYFPQETALHLYVLSIMKALQSKPIKAAAGSGKSFDLMTKLVSELKKQDVHSLPPAKTSARRAAQQFQHRLYEVLHESLEIALHEVGNVTGKKG